MPWGIASPHSGSQAGCPAPSHPAGTLPAACRQRSGGILVWACSSRQKPWAAARSMCPFPLEIPEHPLSEGSRRAGSRQRAHAEPMPNAFRAHSVHARSRLRTIRLCGVDYQMFWRAGCAACVLRIVAVGGLRKQAGVPAAPGMAYRFRAVPSHKRKHGCQKKMSATPVLRTLRTR